MNRLVEPARHGQQQQAFPSFEWLFNTRQNRHLTGDSCHTFFFSFISACWTAKWLFFAPAQLQLRRPEVVASSFYIFLLSLSLLMISTSCLEDCAHIARSQTKS